MKKEKYPMRGVLKKYKISMEIPPEKRDAFIKNTQPSLIEILKQEKEWSIFLACTLGLFFFFKKIGWGISMKASSILFVILAATAAAASLSAGGYFVYSNINKPLVETKAEPVGVVEKTEKEIEKLPVVVKSPKTEKRIRIKIEPEGMNSLVFSRTEEIIKKSFRSWKGDRFANSQIVGDAIKSDDDGDETVFISIRLIVNTVKDGKIKSAQFIVLDTNFKNDTVMLNKLPGELKNRVDKFKNKVK